MKIFFGFDKYASVTSMFLQLGLPSFNTLMHSYRFSFAQRITVSDSCLVQCTLAALGCLVYISHV